MKKLYDLWLGVLVAFLLLPLGEINAQKIPGWGGQRMISSTNVRPNTPVQITHSDGCFGQVKWFNSNQELVGIGETFVVSQPTVGQYSYYFECDGWIGVDQDYRTLTFTVSNAEKSPTPSVSYSVSDYGDGRISELLKAEGCYGDVKWLSGNHVVAEGAYLQVIGDNGHAELSYQPYHKFKAYCTEYEKTVSDAAEISFGQTSQERNLPYPYVSIYTTQFDETLTPNLPTRLGVNNCYGAVSWEKNGVAFSTELSPLITPQCGDVYKLKCTYDRWICSGSESPNSNGDGCCTPNSGGPCPNIVRESQVAILQSNSISISAHPQSQTVLAGANINLSVTASNGIGYQWRKNEVNINGAVNSSYTIVNSIVADAGDYDVIVKGAGACSADKISNKATITISSGATLTMSSTAVTCNGGNNGTATVNATGGTPPYTYSWPNGGNTATITGLTAGNYTVTVTDASGVVKSSSVVVTEPPALVVNPSNTPVKCNGGNDGTATVNVSGGTGTYTYSWSGGVTSTTNTATGLVAGTYTVTVKDANNCEKSVAITITEPSAIVMTPSSTPVRCKNGNDGTATVAVSGGTGSYTYTWSGGVTSTTNTATGLTVGSYTVTVKDANNCQKSITITINEPATLLTISIANSTNISCFGANNGTATGQISGGNTPYTYLWSNGTTNLTTTNLGAGVNTLQVTDANGCIKSASVTIMEPAAIVLTPSSTTVKCFGGNDGTATVTASGGTGSYTYSWSGGITSTTNTATGLTAGTYTVTVKDANNCQKNINITVTEPSALVLTPNTTAVTCNGGTDGTASVTVNGGTEPYTYTWSGGSISTTNTATGLTAGTYTVLVKDANNCQKSITITVAEPTPLALTSSSTPVKCKGSNDGTATVTASGGTGSYTYSWSNGITSTSNTVTGLTSGSYTVTVKDANNCQKSITIVVSEPSTLLTVSIANSTNISCYGANNGTATGQVTGGVSPYSYLWSNGSTDLLATNLGPGNHTLQVTDANGCIKTAEIEFLEPPALFITPSTTAVTCFGGNNGTASVTVNGGTGTYTYLWSNGSTTSSVTGLSAGVYTVMVKDFKNCQKTIDITITEPDELLLSSGSTNISCNGANDGVASVTVNGGTAPYSHSWSGGITNTTSMVSGLTAGTYTVTVKDANNCTKSMAITITEPAGVILTTSSTPAKCKSGNDGTATVTVSGGTAPYTYSWNGGITSTTNTATGLTAGTYTVTVKDTNNCSKSVTISVGEPSTLLTVTIPAPTNISCNGANDGIATGNVSGGSAPYTYLWSNGNTNLTANNLPAGSNTLQVTDANGCIKTASVTISEPAAIALVPSSNPVKCKSGNDGVASVTASGGAGGYTYLWSSGITSTTNTATGLVAGTYTVTVKDANNCTKSIAIEVTEPDALTLIPNSTAANCNGGNDGTATVTVSGGVAPYTYSWSGGITSTTNTATGLVANTYTVKVKDANNCTKSISITVTEPAAIVLTPSSSPAKCKGGNDGTATVSLTGGTAPYIFSWSGGITSTSNLATGLTAGTYTVTVKDAKNCQKSITITVGEPSTLLTVTIPAPTNISCNGANDGIATGNVSGGSAPYTYLWGNGNTNLTANNLPAGSNTLQVTDANGCIKTASVTISEPAAIALVPISNPVKCKSGNDGVASVTASGGAGGYTYLWSSGITSTTNTATGLVAGTYTVTVKDANNCTKSIAITVTEPDALSLVSSSTAIQCNGGNDGTATVTVSGGVAPYTYSWSGGITSTTNTATGLVANTYTVTVKDANNCTKSISITVTEPAAIVLTPSSSPAKCKGGNDGTVTVSLTGGTAPYIFSWSGGITSTSNFATGLAAGIYTVTVKDAKNCQKSINITVTEPATSLTLTSTATAVKCNAGNDGTATVNVSGGTAPYNYTWSGGITSTTNTATGLVAGNYTVTVRDANNCLKSVVISVGAPTPIVLSPSSTPAKCKGGNDGTASISVSGGIAPYSYSWSGGITSTTNTATGLVAGTYTVIVKDANNCQKNIAITVTEPSAIVLTPSSIAVKCNGSNDGTASVSVSGGVSPYTYSWSGGITSTTNTATGISAGTYTVTVKDANSCQKSIAITITEPTLIVLTPNNTSVKCKGENDGTASVSVSGGTAPYTYSWNGGITSTTNTATGLTAGTYTVTVKDAKNCQKSAIITIAEPATTLTLTSTATAVKCNGGNDGTATVNVSGGTAPYSYAWSGGVASTTNTATGLIAGNYTVTVRDANNCQKSIVISVGASTTISLTPSSTPVKCKGGNDGTASVSVSGGIAPYSYSWSGGITSTTNAATGLSAGTYTVTVKDANNCQKNIAITVTEPSAIVLTPSSIAVKCNGSNDGTASISVSGGIAPYSYSWSGGVTSTTNAATGLSAGTYTVTVKDANNCQNSIAITVSEPTVLMLASSGTSVKCKAGTDGTATVSASGGTAPYTYLWSNGSTSATVTGLVAGTYTVTVKDANNCQKTSTVTVSEPEALVLVPSSIAVKCSGDGTAMVTVSGGVSPYTYSWDKGVTSTTNVASGLPAGTYTVTVKDANNCEKSVKITIDQPAIITLTSSTVAVKCKGGKDGAASVTVNGGEAPYTYSWSNGSTSATATGLAAGTYTVLVKDVNGCEKSIDISVTEPEALTLVSTSVTVKCKGGSDGVASVSVSGGTAPYTYAWSNGITSTTNTAMGLTAGTYTVTVKDANNCQQSTLVSVAEPTALSAITSSENVKCKGGNDGTASVSVSGGTAPYSYAWSGGIASTTQTATGLAAGTYTVTITDANGCQQLTTVSVGEPALALSLSSVSTGVKCNGGNDGTASVGVNGGTAPYTYAWSGGITSTTQSATGLAAGTYMVTVKDANGCQKSMTITVSEPTGMELTATSEPAKCFGAKDGIASVSVSGGTAPYTYAWSGSITSITNIATDLAAGAYTVTVKDANNCQKTLTITVNQPVALVLTSATTTVRCNGGNDGTATVSVSGGTTPYSYVWSNGITSTTNTATGLAAGTYTVTVKDANNCQQSTNITVVQPAGMVLTPTVVAVKCKGGNDGSASIGVTGGTAPYTYAWNGGITSTSNSATGLAAGTYTVTVKDANNCQQMVSISITEPAALVLTPSSTAANCAGSTDGTASVAVSGGTAPYSYAWSGGITSTTSTAKGLAAGTYTVTVKDANNCQQTVSITITEPDAATRMVLTTDVRQIRCFGGTGSATVAVTGGISPYTYVWSNGATTPELTNAIAGEYTVTVKDAKGCTTAKIVTIVSPTEMVLTPTIVDVKCTSEATGRILLSVTGGTAPYTYLWSNGAKTSAVTGLRAGIYRVTVSDATNCSKTMEVTITEPQEKLQQLIFQSNVTCKGGANGQLTSFSFGGTAPYTYLWSNGSTNQTIENLVAGTYSVKLTDANNCVVDSQAVVKEPQSSISIVSKIVSPPCKGDAGLIELKATGANGGTDPLQFYYLWSDGFMGSTRVGMAGTYTVEVIDLLGCSKVESFKIEEPLQSLTLTTDITAEKCFDSKNGTAVVTAIGGVAPYQYLWSTGDTTFQISTFQRGGISVRVTDKNGCTRETYQFVNGPEPLQVSTDVTDILCYDGKDGKIRVNISGGTWPMEVSVRGNDIATGVNLGLTNEVSSLKAGTYQITGKDKNGCVSPTQEVTIKQPLTPLTVSLVEATSPRGFGLADGKLQLVVKGGTSPSGYYTNTWQVNGTPFDNVTTTASGTDFTIQSSSAVGGNYMVTVTDNNYELATDKKGCRVDYTYFLKQPDKLMATSIVFKKPSCAGKIDGEIGADIKGGVPISESGAFSERYKLQWFRKNNEELVDLNTNEATIKNAESGIYVVKVTDKNDISATFELELTPTPSIYANFRTIQPQCKNQKTGGIELVNIEGGVAPYTITWNKGLSGPNLSNLEAGNYYAIIKDRNGCYGEAAVGLKEVFDFSINLVAKKDLVCKGNCEGELEVKITGTGALNPYSFSWQNGSTTQKITKRCAGIYTATVANSRGCRVTKSFEIKEPENAYTIEVSNDLLFCASSEVEVNATQTDAKAYSWTLPDGKLLSTPVASIGQPGQYKVEVTNALGCKASDVFNVTIIDVKTTATFAMSYVGLVGERIYAVNLTPSIPVRWRVSSELKIDYEGTDQLVFSAQKPGEYKIEMIVPEDGCEAIVSKKITIFTPPSGRIAPNGLSDESNTTKKQEEAFIVYPNPVATILHLKTQDNKGKEVHATFTDASGRRILERRFTPETNTHQEEFAISELPAGIYFLRVVTDTQQAILKVVKAN
ncbi:T9SS type A sorting domain-containing protein [Runella sp. SP2]|uniref:T9SS type A sorting domain-containing protein n=1 Tax=Runella sp. SP2 TaxID=2268026 RepID=UPI0013DE5A77|nr:T9SS type A sorting domain-containing protein [Runella sp. SP2]